MQALAYYIALPFIYLLAIIPYPLFHVKTYGAYLFLYYVIGYRKKVVRQNLKNAFPQKTDAERRQIEKKFYRYLCDLFLETFKTLIFSKQKAIEHCKLNADAQKLFDNYYAQKKSLIIVLGHFGNWEWAGNTFALQCKHQLYVIYHPLQNKQFNNLTIKMRTRFGTKLIAMRETYKEMVKLKDEINATAFIADQTPAPDNAYWTNFLNQHTPVFWGPERIAKKMNYPVVYVSVKRIKRGYYEIFAETLFENPKDTKEGEISQAHTRKLEKDIIAQPEIWLWSHKRWKHKRPQ
jgi:KDO2-lipid IV(A) lauroyltransferase